MALIRIDSRLIHGQVIESWLPYTGATVIVVANDELSVDIMQQQIMSLAIPGGVECLFVQLDELEAQLSDLADEDVLVLVSNCADARRAYDLGWFYDDLNIGNVHYSPGKKQFSPSVSLSSEEEGCLRYLYKKGVVLDFRCVPNDPVQVRFPA